jgi:hypothetical protein
LPGWQSGFAIAFQRCLALDIAKLQSTPTGK